MSTTLLSAGEAGGKLQGTLVDVVEGTTPSDLRGVPPSDCQD